MAKWFDFFVNAFQFKEIGNTILYLAIYTHDAITAS